VRIGILIHLCFSLWIYTNQNIFPTKVYFKGNSKTGYIKDNSVGGRLISNYGLPFTILLGLSIIIFIIEYTVMAGACYICRWMKRFKLNSVEKKAPSFKDIEKWLAIYGNNTYDPFENG